jgi:polysaccharide biosynthesis protein PelC
MRAVKWIPIALGLLLALGCSGMGSTTFVHPDYNFGYLEKVAVIPFENTSKDQGAGVRATRFYVTELLSAQAFDVVEPGEVARVLAGHGLVRTADLNREQILAIGSELGAQAIFLGSVGESATQRSGNSNTSIVTLNTRLVETETGETIWSATHSESGGGFWSSLFGTRERSRSEVTRDCVSKSIKTLIN